MVLFQELHPPTHPTSSIHQPQPNKHTNLQYGNYYGTCSFLETDFSVFQALCLRSATTHFKITTLFCLQKQRHVWLVSINYTASPKEITWNTWHIIITTELQQFKCLFLQTTDDVSTTAVLHKMTFTVHPSSKQCNRHWRHTLLSMAAAH
jgi:hypothetical protein